MKVISLTHYNTQTESTLVHGHRYFTVVAKSGPFMRTQTFDIFWPKGGRMMYRASGKPVAKAHELSIFNFLQEQIK